MKLKRWYADRGPKFVYQRGARLLSRYSFAPGKAMRRIERCVATLAEHGCAPTFPTPGILLERNPDFVRRLQGEGAEIAVHGYQHVNLNAFTLEEARGQLERAARTFERLGIQAHGFRGPYIGCGDELIDSLPAGLFGYSSNKAIRWDSFIDASSQKKGYYATVEKFYQARDSVDTMCVPWNRSRLVEIPVCVPDDLQLLDGLQLGTVGLAQAWRQMLQQTYQRGELFTLLFHTELAALCEQPFKDLLCTAHAYQPPVWIARLYEIADWWAEKSAFKVEITPDNSSLILEFSCSARATILARGLGSFGSAGIWDGAYYRLPADTLRLPAGPHPFVGLHKDAPEKVVSFLKEQGYIVHTGEMAASCGTYIDIVTLSRLSSQVQIINYIESQSSPLVRYGRWPEGAKSALCVTGDLDALSLMDYASRLFHR
jgi:peptidoglycan/xylan/chitin deacetylase (PgdA/CDA1 family)